MFIRKRKLFIAIIIVAILLVSGGVAWWGLHHEGSNSNQNTTGITLVKLSSEDLISQVTVLRAADKSVDAQKLIEYQDYYKDGSFVTVLYAQILGVNGKVDTALQVLKDAEKGKDNAYYYRGHAASILAVAGKKTEAIAYYNQAIALASELHPTDNAGSIKVASSIGDYEWSVKQLEVASE